MATPLPWPNWLWWAPRPTLIRHQTGRHLCLVECTRQGLGPGIRERTWKETRSKRPRWTVQDLPRTQLRRTLRSEMSTRKWRRTWLPSATFHVSEIRQAERRLIWSDIASDDDADGPLSAIFRKLSTVCRIAYWHGYACRGSSHDRGPLVFADPWAYRRR